MKYLKKFNEEYELSIEDWCSELYLDEYDISNDGVVDVKYSVTIYKKYDKIPIQFGKIHGYFKCQRVNLKTLEGCPREVLLSFDCSDNKLESLAGGPEIVKGGYYCYKNKLISLEGCPKKMKAKMITYGNPIYDIYKLFPDHESYLDSLDLKYLRGDKIIKKRLEKALKENGYEYIELPEFIEGYTYV
jgi:hypothetical protein